MRRFAGDIDRQSYWDIVTARGTGTPSGDRPWSLTCGRIMAAAADRIRRGLEAERGRLAPWLPVFLAIGVVVYYSLRAEPWPWLGAILVLSMGAPMLVYRRHDGIRLLLAPLLTTAVGFTAAQYATARAPPLIPDLPWNATIVAGAIRAIDTLPDGRRITLDEPRLDQRDVPLPRAVRVRLRASDQTELLTGDRVRVRAMVRPIGPPVLPGGWDMQRDTFYSGLGGSGYALGPVEVLAHGPPPGLWGWMRHLAEAAAARITAAIPGSSGQVAVGILIGDQTGIARADMAAFRDSGLAHVLSVSGLHLAIVLGVTMMTVRFMLALSEHASLFWPTRSIAAVVALAVGAFYTALTGAQVPTVRCLLMACLFTLALLTGRRVISLRGLAAAAALVILVEPWQALGASLQMSFFAVLALISGFEALRPWLTRSPGQGWRRHSVLFVLGLMASSLLAGTATLPFGAYHFGRVQIYYIASNMIGVPLTSVLVMPAGMLALLLMPLNLEGLALIPVRWGIDATLWVAHTTANLPAATLGVPRMTAWGLGLFAFGMTWLGLWTGRVRWIGLAPMLIGILTPLLARPPDILISADARLIAVRTADGVYLQQTQSGSGFVRGAWLHQWGENEAEKLPMSGQTANGAIRCDKAGCFLRPRPDAKRAYLARSADRLGDCSDISVIVSAEPARGLCARPWPALVDRFTVWRDGPTAIWLEPSGARVLTDRADRGARPWVPPPPTPRNRPPPKLPVAPTEGGPGTIKREFWQDNPDHE